MISSLMLATVLLAQGCAGGNCGGGYYMGDGYAGGNCGGGYMVAQGPQLVWQIANVPGGERTRSYVKANVDGKMLTIPVINGRLPVVTHTVSTYEERLFLDYGQDYPYTTAYKCGITYDSKASLAAHKNGPSAVKSYENQQNAAAKKVDKKKSGPSGLKTPDALSKAAAANKTEKKEDDTLPSPTRTPSRPSDKEVDDLLK